MVLGVDIPLFKFATDLGSNFDICLMGIPKLQLNLSGQSTSSSKIRIPPESYRSLISWESQPAGKGPLDSHGFHTGTTWNPGTTPDGPAVINRMV